MNRRDLIKSVLTLIAASSVARTGFAESTEAARMPVLFIGHGSPMNIVRDNPFTQHLKKLGETLPTPRAVLVISAHWIENETRLTSAAIPETIHDFGGFPDELYQINYASPGAPELATQTAAQLTRFSGRVDGERGLDHGAWSVLHHLYPKADIPVIQLAMNAQLTFAEHIEVGRALQSLREQGVLILASGNLVHNLRRVNRAPNAPAYDWTLEFDEMIKQALLARDLNTLMAGDPSKHSLWRTCHPSIEHYVPLLYALGAAGEQETVQFPYEGYELASISMRSVMFG